MTISFSEYALVVLVGADEGARAAFARRHFSTRERLSLERCLRHGVSEQVALDTLEEIAHRRLKVRRRLVAVDAPNLTQMERAGWVRLARRAYAEPVVIVLGGGKRLPDARELRREGFNTVAHVSLAGGSQTALERLPLPNDRRDLRGPFDIVGDVHGCFDELLDLLALLGYHVQQRDHGFEVTAPPGRTLVFVGDLVDRGPNTPDALRLAMSAVASGGAFAVPGNHDDKLMRALMGRNVQTTHGLDVSLAQLAREPQAFRDRVRAFIDGLPSHYVFDGGRLIVAHAGIRESMIGRWPQAARDFTLYGETNNQTDAYGLPVRLNWMAKYHGAGLIVYGHTPVLEPVRINNTLNIDTGCVFGGKLTALRYPEMALVSVPARMTYATSNRPLLTVADF